MNFPRLRLLAARCGCWSVAAVMLTSCSSVRPSPPVLFQSIAAKHADRAFVIQGVPDVPRRGGMEDGVAVLVDLANFWQKPLTYSNAAAMMLKARRGMAAEEALVVSAGTLGLWSFSTHGTTNEIISKIRSGIPVAVILQDWSGIESRRFTVIVGFDDVTRQFLCNDGAAEPATCSYDEFYRKWIPVRFWMAVMCPPEAAHWPMSVEDLLSRGRLYESRGLLPEARRDLESALQKRPDSDEIKQALAVNLQGTGDFARAEPIFRALHEKYPDTPRTANNLAYVLARQHKSLDEAERLARSVVQREPTYPAALDTLGYVLVLRNNFAEAIPLLETAYDRAQNVDAAAQHEIAVHLALAYLGDRREQMMKKIVSEILAADPTFKLPDELKQPIRTP